MSIQSMLNNTCDVQRYTIVTDSMGGQTKTWATLHRNLPCRFSAGRPRGSRGAERFQWDRVAGFANPILYCEYADITEADRIVKGSRIFDVKQVTNWAEIDNYLIIELEEVK